MKLKLLLATLSLAFTTTAFSANAADKTSKEIFAECKVEMQKEGFKGKELNKKTKECYKKKAPKKNKKTKKAK